TSARPCCRVGHTTCCASSFQFLCEPLGIIMTFSVSAPNVSRFLFQVGSLLACLLFWQVAATQRLDFGFVAFTYVPTPNEVLTAAWIWLAQISYCRILAVVSAACSLATFLQRYSVF